MTTLNFNVTGMTCAACSARVEAAIRRLPGVADVAVGLLTNSARVEGDVEPSAVVAAVERAGYRATLKSANGASGANGGEKAVGESGVNGANGERGAKFGDKNGFGDDPEAAQEREASARRRRTIVAAVLLIPLFYSACGVGLFGFPLPGVVANPLGRGLLQLLLTAAILGVERRFFVDGWTSLRRGAPTMDALVATGSGASFVFSVGVLFAAADAAFGGDLARAAALANGLYFESAAMILVFVGFGKMLEARAKGRATSALTALARLAPETAAVERGEDGVEERVPTDRVRVGDVFVVRPGERIPVDGVVLDGESAVDESALTGESVPDEKGPGSDVSAGTLNASGFLRCRATRVGENATLGQIVRLTAEAAATKAPIARAADRIAAVFVPTVLTLAAATTGAWLIVGAELGFAVARGVAVLVVSCPCALGLATPAAIAVASGVGARRGILFKTAEALENAGKTEFLTLDKTGTLTVGKPNVVAVVPAPGVSEAELIGVAAALERKSEHPLARAVVEYAAEYWGKSGESGKAEKTGETEESLETEKSAEVGDFRAVVGAGLTGTLGGAPVVGGKRAFVAKAAAIPAELTEAAERFAEDGRTSLFFACGGKALGVVAVSDVEKADAAEAVSALRRLGVRVCVATGDERRVARALGRRVGIEPSEIVADANPAEKERIVRALAAFGPTAMIGDGINDAPALTRADVGFAVRTGTDVAVDAADVVLLGERLADAPAAIRLSRATLRIIRQNLFWAFAYNAVGIPLAAGVWAPFGWALSPAFCAAAMSLSSFCVVSNALRLSRFNPNDARGDRPARRFGDAETSASSVKSVKTLSEILSAAASENDVRRENNEKETKMKKVVKIEGMMCGHCEARVKRTLEAAPGVAAALVDHTAGTAVVEFADGADVDATLAALTAAVEADGYAVKGVE